MTKKPLSIDNLCASLHENLNVTSPIAQPVPSVGIGKPLSTTSASSGGRGGGLPTGEVSLIYLSLDLAGRKCLARVGEIVSVVRTRWLGLIIVGQAFIGLRSKNSLPSHQLIAFLVERRGLEPLRSVLCVCLGRTWPWTTLKWWSF
mmetsp:Transcript_2339/g.4487  ORF Transcript_2339/g.4487 Transcript_2339/m.4487 type:complete len:146 (+) Transcript_2339:120-557(+)